MSNKQSFFRNLITAGIPGGFEISDVRKAVILNIFSTIGTCFAFLFGIKDVKEGHLVIGFVTLSIGILFISVLTYFRIRKNIKFSVAANTFLISALYVFLIAFGQNAEMILWAFNFPIVAYFLLGRRTGTITSLALIAVYLFFFIFPTFTRMTFSEGFALRFVSGYFAVVLLMYAFERIRAAIYKKLMYANLENSEYIAETEQQTEELHAQAENLKANNEELEKLTLVAENTDNIVQIISPEGKVEWVNKSFSKVYDLSFEEYIQKYGASIFSEDKDRATQRAFKKCVNDKKTVQYQAKSRIGQNSEVSTQVTLSPTLNIKNEVVKVIAIETDISKLKKAEEEILKQSAEMYSQKEELQTQNDEISSQNKLLRKQNESIREGIAVAQKIQHVILPSKKILDAAFDNFILFRPKDVVSGDFYWHAELLDKSCTFTVVADCTGHGVPGAFMSMIGSRLLSEIVMVDGILDPKEILTELHIRVVKELQQETTANNDGMDLCLMKVGKSENEGVDITYCGAKRPLIIVPKSGEIKTLKGSRKSIGGTQQKRTVIHFENENITLQKGDTVYLSSDGYIDQNNVQRQKFGTPKLYIVLEEIRALELKEQKSILNSVLEQYMGEATQRDDISIMGVRF